MDDLADRAPNLAAFYVPQHSDKIIKVVSMESQLRPNCDGLRDKFGCYDLVFSQ